MLGLIFLRFADARFAVADEEIKKEQPASTRRVISRTDYQARDVLYLPEAARFSHLLDLPEPADIGGSINNAMRPIGEDNEELRGVLPTDYNALDKDVLISRLKTFSRIPSTSRVTPLAASMSTSSASSPWPRGRRAVSSSPRPPWSS